MRNTKGLGVIEGDRKTDIVTVKIIQRAGSAVGFIAFVGACDLDTYEKTVDAFEEQGFLDLVDQDATKMRIYKDGTLALIHVSTKPRQPKGIIVPASH